MTIGWKKYDAHVNVYVEGIGSVFISAFQDAPDQAEGTTCVVDRNGAYRYLQDSTPCTLMEAE